MSQSAPPVLGLLLGGSGAELLPLLTALRRWCDPQALHRAVRPVALLMDEPPRAEPPASATGLPYAIASRDPAVLTAAGALGFFAPDGAPSGGARYVPPFVRARLRAERRLPEVTLRPDRRWPGRAALPDDLLETAFGCAVAVVADTPAFAERALAWGAPLVCDRATAAALDLTDGWNALVDADPDLVAGDAQLAARLSWNGRRHWERRHDADQTAAELAVFLLPSDADVAARHLSAMGTARGAGIELRLGSAAFG